MLLRRRPSRAALHRRFAACRKCSDRGLHTRASEILLSSDASSLSWSDIPLAARAQRRPAALRRTQRPADPVVLVCFLHSVGMTSSLPFPPPSVCVPIPHRPSRSAKVALRRVRPMDCSRGQQLVICEALPPGPGRPAATWTGEDWRQLGAAAAEPARVQRRREPSRVGVCAAWRARGGGGPRAAGARPDDPGLRRNAQWRTTVTWARLQGNRSAAQRTAGAGSDSQLRWGRPGAPPRALGPRRRLRSSVPLCRPRCPSPSVGPAVPSGRRHGYSRTAPARNAQRARGNAARLLGNRRGEPDPVELAKD